MNIKQRARQLKLDIPAVFLSLKSKDTPLIAKVFAFITVFYALSPIDLIPDFIPVLGYLDDIIILPLFIALTIRFIPKEIFKRFQDESKSLWQNGVPKKWYYSIPIIIIWILVIYLFLRVLDIII